MTIALAAEQPTFASITYQPAAQQHLRLVDSSDWVRVPRRVALTGRELEDEFSQFVNEMDEWARRSLPFVHETWPTE